jgi:hypothetical protein
MAYSNKQKKSFINFCINTILFKIEFTERNPSHWFNKLELKERISFTKQKNEEISNPKIKPSMFCAKYKDFLNEYYGTVDRGYINKLPFNIK